MVVYLLYLTSGRLDIMVNMCLCARFQSCSKEYHLFYINRMIKYLKGSTNVGLWYPKDSLCDLVDYSDSDYARCKTGQKY